MRQKILDLLSGKKVDSPPAFSGLIHVTAEGLQSEGLAFHEVHKDARKMAKAAASTFKLSGLPSAALPLDMYVEAEALGAEINFREGVELSEAILFLEGMLLEKAVSGELEQKVNKCLDERGEVFISGVNIRAYSHRGYADHEPTRRRKLLLHKLEIRKLIGKTTERGMTLVPVRMYFKNGRVKIAISLAKGKKDYDRRETIKRREIDRETRAAVKERGR